MVRGRMSAPVGSHVNLEGFDDGVLQERVGAAAGAARGQRGPFGVERVGQRPTGVRERAPRWNGRQLLRRSRRTSRRFGYWRRQRCGPANTHQNKIEKKTSNQSSMKLDRQRRQPSWRHVGTAVSFSCSSITFRFCTSRFISYTLAFKQKSSWYRLNKEDQSCCLTALYLIVDLN